MIRALAAVWTLAAGWSFTDFNLDRMRWNARERTTAGIEILETDKKANAVGAFETAAALDFEDPILRYNAGAAHLAAGTEGALEHLEQAVEFAPDHLRAPASYNLGNARMAAGDAAGAIEAFEDTLRQSPSHENAKFNLELALKQQQEQQEQQQQNQEDQEKKDQDGQSDKTDEQNPGEQPPPQEEGDNQGDPEQEKPGEQDGEGQKPEDGDGDQPLPQFEEQPDMTAEQAAAILEAVENLEREQRRKQAEAEMKKRPKKGKDW